MHYFTTINKNVNGAEQKHQNLDITLSQLLTPGKFKISNTKWENMAYRHMFLKVTEVSV